jgi:hypothetical protein
MCSSAQGRGDAAMGWLYTKVNRCLALADSARPCSCLRFRAAAPVAVLGSGDGRNFAEFAR